MRLRVTSLAYEAKDIVSVELRSPWTSTLPPFTPGAHIDVSLPNGLSRSYSLINPKEERHRFVVVVRREPDSRGASSFIHQALRLGQIVEVREPRNPAADGGFSVVLARSGIRIDVPKGRTILDALLDEGIDPPHSCREGICGTCEVPVLQGIPDHRDLVLSKAQQESNRSMLICCSGSKTEEITIDL